MRACFTTYTHNYTLLLFAMLQIFGFVWINNNRHWWFMCRSAIRSAISAEPRSSTTTKQQHCKKKPHNKYRQHRTNIPPSIHVSYQIKTENPRQSQPILTIIPIPILYSSSTEECFLTDNIYDYHNVSQGKVTIPSMDDSEEFTLTDVSFATH